MSRYGTAATFATLSGGIDAWFNPYEGTWRINDACDFDAWRWMPQAACKDHDPNLFFDTRSHIQDPSLRILCASCPVRRQCLDHALSRDEYGWWGGTSRDERLKLLGRA